MSTEHPVWGSTYEDWHPGELERLPDMIRSVRAMIDPQARAEELEAREAQIQHEQEKYRLLDLDELEGSIEVPTGCLAEIGRVIDERIRQHEIWGIQRVSLAEWGLILGEEYGEAIADATSLHFTNADEVPRARTIANLQCLRDELSHTAAVAIAWMEHVTENLEALGEKDR